MSVQSTQKVNKNEEFSLIPYLELSITPGWIRSGYRFIKWNTKPDGTGVDYIDGATIVSGFNKDTTLYAIWELDQVESDLLLNGIDILILESGLDLLMENDEEFELEMSNSDDGELLLNTNEPLGLNE